MILSVGLAVLGASRVFMRLRGGYTLMLLGFAGGSLVRPHVMLIVLVGFIVALAIGRRVTKPGVTPSSVAKVAGLVLLIVVGTFLVGRTQSVVGGSGVADFDTVLSADGHPDATGHVGVLTAEPALADRLSRRGRHRADPPVPLRVERARADRDVARRRVPRACSSCCRGDGSSRSPDGCAPSRT